MPYLTANQVAQYAYNAGFRGNLLATMIDIAYAESRFNTNAYNGTLGTYGLWQVEAKVHGYANNPTALFNPATNAQATFALYKIAGLNPWYGDGYQAYTGIGAQAAHAISPATASGPQIQAANVKVNGQPFPAVVINGSTYLLYTVLNKFGIPYIFLGNAAFQVTLPNGQQTRIYGVVYNGQNYIPWGQIPGIKVTYAGGTNFTESILAYGAIGVMGYAVYSMMFR